MFKRNILLVLLYAFDLKIFVEYFSGKCLHSQNFFFILSDYTEEIKL